MFWTILLKQPAHGCETFSGNELCLNYFHTAQKLKFSIKDIFSKCDQTRSFLWIWSYLLKKSLMENFIFCLALASYAADLCLHTVTSAEVMKVSL